ncbi:MAG: response regulator [Micromonosporaceae bacterium]
MSNGTPRLVLVVEDEQQDVERLDSVLNEYAVVTEVLPRAFEANAYLRREHGYTTAARPALVLLDWKLAGGGESVLKTIRETEAIQATPVVVLSRSAADVDVRAAYAGHANAFVVKPADLDEYRRRLTSICDFFLRVSELPVPRD